MRAALVVACWAALSIPAAVVVAAVVRATRGADLAEEVELYLKGLGTRHRSLRRPLTLITLGTVLVALGAVLAAPLRDVSDRVYTVAAGTREMFGDGPGPGPASEVPEATTPASVPSDAAPTEPVEPGAAPSSAAAERTLTAAGFTESSRSWWWVGGDVAEGETDSASTAGADEHGEDGDEDAVVDGDDSTGDHGPPDRGEHPDGDDARAEEAHASPGRPEEPDEAPAADEPPAEEEQPSEREPSDVDGDGVIDAEDDDVDGDGIPNDEDDDLDGDGIPNDEDDDGAEGEGSADTQEQQAP